VKIFISSTFSDLIEERKVVHETIRKMGYEHIWMEDFAANSKHPRDVCLGKVQECDAVILLLGSSYGSSRDEKTGLSYTHLEYRTAREKHIPVLAFIKKPEQGKWESAETDEEARKYHIEFKDDVERNVIRKSFSSLTELEKVIQEAIHNHAREHGWIGTPRSAFQTVEQFYQPFLNPDTLFHHTLPLTGRESYLQALIDFSSSDKQVALLPGPDGIGKSRLLLEALRKIDTAQQDLKVLVLSSPYTAANEHELPGGKILIGVDDAQTRDIKSVEALFRMVRSYSDRIKLIVAIRPDQLDEVRQRLILANFQLKDEILEFRPLRGIENPVALAEAILGKQDLNRIHQLVALASDSPLIMVIAGELLKRGQIRHTLLASSHEDFRREVVLRYQLAASSSISSSIPPERVQKVSALLAALGPFDISNEPLVEQAATFLQLDTDQLLETLDHLEKAGLALRRRDSYSCAPDAMTYSILEQACFLSSGRPKEFGSRVALAFTKPWQTHALKRLAEVDWLKGRGQDTGLLTRFWQQKQEQFSTGTTDDRIALLQILHDVAYFQPKVALDFVQLALHTPDPTSSENHESIPEQAKLYLPNILGQIAYHINYMKTAINILWELGKSDSSDMSRSTDHAHHVLIELSKQRYGRIAAFYDTYLQCVEMWCTEVNAFERGFTPLQIIPSFLARDGSADYYFSQPQSIHIQSFYILPEPMRDIRKRAIHLLASIGQMNERPKLQYHAVEVLRNLIIRGLTYNNTPELRAQWYEEDQAILVELTSLAQKAKSAFLSYSIEYGLRIALKHPDNAPIAEDLRATLTALPLDLDTEIIWYLKHGISAKQFSKEQSEGQVGSDDTTFREVAERVLRTYPTAQNMKQKLDALLSHLALYNQHIVYPNFLEVLTEIDHVLGHQLCRLVTDDPSSPTVDYFTYFVLPLRKWNATTFLDLVRDALNSDNPSLRRGAAYAIYRVTDFTDEEGTILITLIQDADPIVAMGAIYAIHQLPEEAQETAFSALDEVSFTSEDERVVDATCEAMHRRMSNPLWNPIPSLTTFLQKCVPLPELSEQKHYRLCSFLLECRWRFPQIVANFCLDRVKFRRSLPAKQQTRYESISCLSTHLVPESRAVNEQHSEERYQALCTIRDELLAFEESEIITIFAYLANGYDATTLQVLSDWLESGAEQKIRLVAKLIQEAPPSFVFDNEAFVERLLSTAAVISKDVSKQMGNALQNSAMPFAFVGIPDVLSDERVQIRDRARQTADKYPSKSAMHEFYMDLSKEADYRIEMQHSFLNEQNQPKQVIVA
jgi:Domain of unknown function (DUF4062)